jgi:hypothetical protein
MSLARNSIADIKQNSTVNAYWVQGHADKRGPPYLQQEELSMLTDGKAQTAFPPETKPFPNCLHFTEQHISIVRKQLKVASHLPYHISNAIYGPKLTNYLKDKENWSVSVFQSIQWDSFSIAFNKLTTARQIVTTNTMYSFWCTNSRHK